MDQHLSKVAEVASALSASLCHSKMTRRKKDAGKSAKKDKDPVNKSRGQAKKKSEGRVCDKLNNLVLFDKATYNKLCRERLNYWVG